MEVVETDIAVHELLRSGLIFSDEDVSRKHDNQFSRLATSTTNQDAAILSCDEAETIGLHLEISFSFIDDCTNFLEGVKSKYRLYNLVAVDLRDSKLLSSLDS